MHLIAGSGARHIVRYVSRKGSHTVRPRPEISQLNSRTRLHSNAETKAPASLLGLLPCNSTESEFSAHTAVLETAALPMSYTLELVLTSGVEPESPGSQPSTLPLSYISMVPMG
jgi:hypothetical protein